MSIKVLHVLDHSIPLHSGYTFRTRAILKQQQAMGFATFHITGSKQNKYQAPEEEVDGLKFYRTPAGAMERLPVFNQMDVIRGLKKRLREVVAQVKPDVIHAHSPALNGWAAAQVAKEFGIPFVYEIRAFWEDAAVDHGTTKEGSLRYRLTRLLETQVIEKADWVTCICEGLRQDIKARGFSDKPVTLIPNAVNLEQFPLSEGKDAELLQQLDLDGRPVIGFIGSFYAYEGLDLLVNAMPSVIERHPDARLLLVGGGSQADLVDSLVQRHGLQDAVIRTGRVPHDEVGRYYDLVDIFAYPRKSMRLTELVTPLKPLEAMAKGKLVVASDVGGHRELIRHGDNGFLFPSNDADALARVLSDLLSKREQWPEIQQRGRQYVEEERNWPNATAPYQTIYQTLLAEKAVA